MRVSWNRGTPKSLVGFSIRNHPAMGVPHSWKHSYNHSSPLFAQLWSCPAMSPLSPEASLALDGSGVSAGNESWRGERPRRVVQLFHAVVQHVQCEVGRCFQSMINPYVGTVYVGTVYIYIHTIMYTICVYKYININKYIYIYTYVCGYRKEM